MEKLIRSQGVRYVFFGGCTTLVNLVMTYVLQNILGINLVTANTIAILSAITFAYVVNKLFVFEHRADSAWSLLKEAGGFFGMRLGTMVVEVMGMVFLASVLGMNAFAAKLILQVLILILNYLISKFVVFKEKDIQTDRLELQKKKQAVLYFWCGFAVSATIALAGFVCIHIWPFGDRTVLSVDAIHQYLPFYTDFHEKLVNNQSLLYSFAGGLGYNFWSTYAYYMASPLNFLMAFIPTQNVCDFMDWVVFFKIALSGGCFAWYLHERNREQKYLPVVFGAMYALSNFVIGYYFNLMWLDSIAMLPLIMKGIERIIEGKSGRLFCITLFYGLWCNYYIGFMLCIFSCLYFLVCSVSQERLTWAGIWKSCLTFGWYALLSGGMAALVLLPAFMGLGLSQSIQGNSFPKTFKFYVDLGELLERHMAFLEPIKISDNQVGLNAYCGVLVMLGVPLYLLDHKRKIRERLAHFLLMALLLFSFAFNILNYIWHGFHIQNGLPNRFAFIYIAVVLVMSYDALGHLKWFNLAELTLAFAAPVGFLAARWLEPGQDLKTHVFIITFGFLLLYYSILLIGKYLLQRERKLFPAILSLVLLVEVAANGINGMSCVGSVHRQMYIDDQISYRKMMDGKVEEEGFFRSEVDRQRMRNVTMFVGGNALVMFNSTMADSFIQLCSSLGIEARTNKNGYLGVSKLMNDVFGIKYLASPQKVADTMYGFRKVDEDGELDLYKNDNALSLGFMVRDTIRDWDISSSEPLMVQNDFVEKATGHEPIFVLDRYIDMEDEQSYGIKVPENKQVYLCIDNRVKKIQMTTPEYTKTFDDYNDHLYPVNRVGQQELANFTVNLKENQSPVKAEVYTCPNQAYQEVIDALAEHQLENLVVDGNLVTGKIQVKDAGTMMLTIPYDEGWQIMANGTVLQQYPIGEALTGVHLEAGEYEIQMKYTPGGLWLGTLLSLICALLFLLSGIWEKRHPQWIQGNENIDLEYDIYADEEDMEDELSVF